MIFDLTQPESPHNYRLLSGGVTPRPIAWISTRSKSGVDNLAPYSFFTVASCQPPVLLFTQVTPRDAMDKDTLRNLMETGECVVNIVTADLLEKMNKTSASIKADDSEFCFAQVSSCQSHSVQVLGVSDSPIRYECTLRELHRISESPSGGSVILLDVKSVYVNDALLNDSEINQSLLDSVGKMGGDRFSLTTNQLELKRP